MAIFQGTPPQLSDEWWINRLERAISDRNRGRAGGRSWSDQRISNDRDTRPGLELLDKWHRGEPPMPSYTSQEWVDSWRAFLRLSRSNYAELVISSITDRLVPVGWSTAADSDPDGDAEAERVARESNLMVVGGDALTDMLALADGYILAGAGADGRPIFTSESPLSTIVADSRHGKRGLRITYDEWTGEKEFWYYKPGFVSVARLSNGRYELGEPQVIPGGVFPLVSMRNRRGVGDFERHLDALNRINDSMFTRIVLTKLQAHRQKALVQDGEGEDAVEVDPEDFASGPDALWSLPSGVKLWESSATDLSQVRHMVLDDVKAVCAATGTPLADAVPDAANQSAKGSQVIEDKYLFRIEDRKRRADRAFAEAMSVGFMILGDEQRSQVHQINTIWAPTERYTISEKAQAAATAKAAGWPFERIALDIFQVRPSELPALNRARMADLLTQGDAGASPA